LNGQPEPAAVADAEKVGVEVQGKQLRDKMRRLDRRLEQVLDAAASGRIDEERLRYLGLGVASEQLAAEEALAEGQRRAQQQATEAERRQHRRDALDRCRDQWEQLTFAERHDLLRELLERVVVRDDSVEVSARP
jgi:hypothetical protein